MKGPHSISLYLIFQVLDGFENRSAKILEYLSKICSDIEGSPNIYTIIKIFKL